MDKVKDILSSIRDRFANPLIFSFACSWIVINWQIPVALLWYNSKDIEKTGSKTIFDFISQRLDATNGFWHPLFFAVAYTVLIPVVRNLIRFLFSNKQVGRKLEFKSAKKWSSSNRKIFKI